MATRCTNDYLPWLLAHDYNFLADGHTLHEIWDIGDDEFMIRLAHIEIPSNCLFIVDQAWEES